MRTALSRPVVVAVALLAILNAEEGIPLSGAKGGAELDRHLAAVGGAGGAQGSSAGAFGVAADVLVGLAAVTLDG